MKKFLALVLVGSFAFLAVAEDKKPADSQKKSGSCKMECCQKDKAECGNKAEGKEKCCAEGKHAGAKKTAKKPADPPKS